MKVQNGNEDFLAALLAQPSSHNHRNVLQDNAAILFRDKKKRPYWQQYILLALATFLVILLIIVLQPDPAQSVSFLSLVLAILFPVFIERVQRPDIKIYSATRELTQRGQVQFWAIKLLVNHEMLPSGLLGLFSNKWLERRAATMCRGMIKFRKLNGDPIPTNRSNRTRQQAPSGGSYMAFHYSLPQNQMSSAGTISAWQYERLTATASGAPSNYSPISTLQQFEGINQGSQQSSLRSLTHLPNMPIRWAGSPQPSTPMLLCLLEVRAGQSTNL